MSEFSDLPALITRKTFRRVAGLSEHSMTALIASRSIRRMILYPTAKKGMYFKVDLARICGLPMYGNNNR